MSTEEILTVKEDIHEMKEDIKGLVTTVNNLRVSIAENYIKKTDCKECKDNQKVKQNFWVPETKKNALKWCGIIVLVIIVLLAGKDLFQLTSIIPK